MRRSSIGSLHMTVGVSLFTYHTCKTKYVQPSFSRTFLFRDMDIPLNKSVFLFDGVTARLQRSFGLLRCSHPVRICGGVYPACWSRSSSSFQFPVRHSSGPEHRTQDRRVISFCDVLLVCRCDMTLPWNNTNDSFVFCSKFQESQNCSSHHLTKLHLTSQNQLLLYPKHVLKINFHNNSLGNFSTPCTRPHLF